MPMLSDLRSVGVGEYLQGGGSIFNGLKPRG